ncbi:MAG: FHA domain-containing protein [Aggregatilineales bacterium]
MQEQIRIAVMSGVEDGSGLHLNAGRDGVIRDSEWTLSIGRREENDICLRQDTFVSRHHAKLHYRDTVWWLEDCKSRNGTFVENEKDFFIDTRVSSGEKNMIPVKIGQLFRVGRTWLKLDVDEVESNHDE